MDFFPSLQDDVRVRLESDLVRLSSETSPQNYGADSDELRLWYGENSPLSYIALLIMSTLQPQMDKVDNVDKVDFIGQTHWQDGKKA